MVKDTVDVVIIGGGLSGLYAAKHLQQNDHSFMVFEASERLGGRTCTIKAGETAWDLGGQWIGDTHVLVKKLLDEFKIDLHPQLDDGTHILEIEKQTRSYAGNISTLNSSGVAGLFTAIDMLDSLSLSKEEPAMKWDKMSVAEWTKENIAHSESRAIIEWFVRVCLAVECYEVSFLAFLRFLRYAGGYSILADIKGGAQQDRIIGGSQQISIRLGELIGLQNILFNSPVTSITQKKKWIVVKSQKHTIRAKHVIVALAPPLAAKISYEPKLPWWREEIHQRMFMGSVLKTITLYKEPFWRKKGFSGEAISDTGPIFICYDDSTHDDKEYAIVGFIAAQAARDWAQKTQEERKAGVVECYRRWWGDDALEPINYFERYWKDEPYSRGCYFSVAPPGLISSFPQTLRTPVGRVHWASTDASTVWYGYMEGALHSGLRAAQEVCTDLNAELQITSKL